MRRQCMSAMYVPAMYVTAMHVLVCHGDVCRHGRAACSVECTAVQPVVDKRDGAERRGQTPA